MDCGVLCEGTLGWTCGECSEWTRRISKDSAERSRGLFLNIVDVTTSLDGEMAGSLPSCVVCDAFHEADSSSAQGSQVTARDLDVGENRDGKKQREKGGGGGGKERKKRKLRIANEFQVKKKIFSKWVFGSQCERKREERKGDGGREKK